VGVGGATTLLGGALWLTAFPLCLLLVEGEFGKWGRLAARKL
jgi:hypothetical protein